MLHPHKSAMSTAVILDVIRELTDDTNYVVLDGIVSAKIRGNLEIDSEPWAAAGFKDTLLRC